MYKIDGGGGLIENKEAGWHDFIDMYFGVKN